MATTATEARKALAGRTIWLWHYLHPDWQWEQSRHWHEDRYALAVAEALDLMQRDSEFCYFFDTTSEFYSAVAQRLGPRLEELKEHVRSGRIRLVSGQVGNCRPTQVGDETYIRNLQLGRKFFEEQLPPTDLSLFHSVDIAIGHTQMPQLLGLAGFKSYRAWRPHGPMNALSIPHQFIWQGIDGSRITVTRGPYTGGWRADQPPGRYGEDWNAAVAWLFDNHLKDQLLQGRSPTDHLWLVQGYDDARPLTELVGDRPMDLLGFVAQWRAREDVPIRWCTPLEYSQAVEAQAGRLRVVEGVLDGADCGYNMANSGSHGLWVWRQMNDRRLVEAERWAAAARVAVASAIAPVREEIKNLWYQHCVYQSHAEDFAFADDWEYLADLARDVKHRAVRIEREAIGKIVQAAGGGTRTIRYLFNPHPWSVEAEVEIYHPCATAGIQSLQVVDENAIPFPQQQLSEFRHPRFGGSINDERRLVRVRLPALGYRRVQITESGDPGPEPAPPPASRAAAEVSLENDMCGAGLPIADYVVDTRDLTLLYRRNALSEVVDRASGHRYGSREGGPWPALLFHVLDGQDWLFAGPEMRRERYLPTGGEWLQAGPIRWHHRSTGTLGPYQVRLDTLVADRGRELQVRVGLEGHWRKPPVTGFVTLLADIEAGGGLTVDVPFAVEPRDPDRDIYAHNVPADPDHGNLEMFERLRPGIFWGRSWADWSGERFGITMLSVDGNYYWLKEPGQFGHVVLRCMELKEGTWEAFCPVSMTGTGAHNFSYALRFHDGDWRQADPQRRSLELRHPPVVARADYPCEAKLPGEHSFLQLEGPAILSAYYDDGDSVCARFYESTGQGGNVMLALDWPPEGAQAVDFLDRPVPVPIVTDGNTVTATVKPWQIVTLRLSRR